MLSGVSMSSVMPEILQLGVEQIIGGFQDSGGPMYLEQVEGAIKMAMKGIRNESPEKE